ncbi:MAG: ABC transporter ATP-binding protein [Acetobacteraceae bacterium]|nr:ABC transporter ATP-binding protein [Acetobacteraceae bacterium]
MRRRAVPAVLEARGLSRRFGGLVAVADMTFTLRPKLAHAVIGPNGAGKSTLIDLLSGALRPDEGTIHLNGEDVTALPDWRRARAGIGRSFQRANLFSTLTAYENVRLAAQSTTPGWRLIGAVCDDAGTWDLALSALEQTGLEAVAEHPAGSLSHGQRRLLEIAVVLAALPDVLLFDEPLAGLGPEETAPVVKLLRKLASTHTMLLVEHDMDVVFAIAGQVTVMVDGRMLESGTPDAIRASAAVRDAYLGHRS